MIRFDDLKARGFELNQDEAQLLHSAINEIAQRGGYNPTLIFADNGTRDVSDPLKEYYLEIGEKYAKAKERISELESEISEKPKRQYNRKDEK